MIISNDNVIDAYNKLVERGHPDPLGFIARAELLTKLNDTSKTSLFVGPFAANIKKAKGQGFSLDDLKDNEKNLDAAFSIDTDAFEKGDRNIDEMYRIAFNGGSKKFDRFFKRLNAKKEELAKNFIFDDSGSLESIETPKRKKRNQGVVVSKRPTNPGVVADDLVGRQVLTDTLEELDEIFDTIVSAIVRETVT